MRILVSSQPLLGHVNTVLPIALAAQRAGHEVVVATGPDLVSHVEQRGLVAWPVGVTLAESGAAGAATDWLALFISSAGKRAVDLVPRALEWRPDLVIHEETELAGAVAARALGARHVVHGLGLMPPPRIWQALAPGVQRLFDQWGIADHSDVVRAATYLELAPPSLRPEYSDPVWTRTQSLRPYSGAPAPGERLPDAIDALPHAETVHLTLGTVFHEAEAVLATAISGLRTLPVNLVVTTGPGSDPTRFGPQPPHVLIAPYLPHALLLARCRLVVAHGGAGILFGALANGLPQLVLPQGADQHLNAEACVRAGAGLALNGPEVTMSAVAAAAERLLAEPTFTARARALQAELESAPSASDVIGILTSPTQRLAGES